MTRAYARSHPDSCDFPQVAALSLQEGGWGDLSEALFNTDVKMRARRRIGNAGRRDEVDLRQRCLSRAGVIDKQTSAPVFNPPRPTGHLLNDQVAAQLN